LAYKSCAIAAAAGFLANKSLSSETVVYKNHDLRSVKSWIWMDGVGQRLGWIPGNYGHTDFSFFLTLIEAGEESKRKTKDYSGVSKSLFAAAAAATAAA
jgi:thioredoxin-related protein